MTQELRLILTQLCNFDCYFCHKEGISEIKKNSLTSDDIEYLYYVANKYFAINTTTISGGEPLILNNIVEITKKLKKLGCKTTIVTNGSLILDRIEIGKYISKLNVSLHSLDSKEYEEIVRRKNYLESVINNIIIFKEKYPNVEVNINYALINKPNLYDEVEKLMVFARLHNCNIKIIELFPKSNEKYYEIEKIQKFLVENQNVELEKQNRKNQYFNGKTSSIYTTKCLCSRAQDFDSPSDFCNKNNDLFISQDGAVNLCRMLNNEISLIKEIKNKNEEELSKKLSLSFKHLGKGCPYEKKSRICRENS